MRKQVRYIFLALFFFVGIITSAQVDKGSMQDTSLVSRLRENNAEGGVFLPVNQVQMIEEKLVPPEKIDSLKKEDAYWYANLKPVKEKTQENQPGKTVFDAGWFNNLLWILIIASFIAVVIWYLASSNMQLFRKAPEKISREEESKITENIFIINYDKEIARAAAAADYRLAVRLWYLRTLKELSEMSIIKYGHEKTNSDYLGDLSGRRYYNDFFRLTRNFEYIWYGQFPLSAEGYAMMQKDFASFINGVA